MEQVKYYDYGIDNTYCVHFANKLGLSIDEITQIFSKWGNVVGVTKAGDDYGYRFVRYRDEDEVKRCVKALKNDRTVRLLPKRPKQQSDGNQNNGQQRNNWSNNNNQESPWGTKITENIEKFNAPKMRSHNNGNLGSKKKAQRSCENDVPVANDDSTHSNKNTEMISEKEEETKNIVTHGNFEVGANRLNQEEVLIIVDNEITPAIVKRETGSSSNLNVTSQPPEGIPDEIPDLVERMLPRERNKSSQEAYAQKDSMIMPLEKQRVIDAEEVVVANVPTDFGQNYILHLLEKYEPICIGPMKFVSASAIRFCVVFFPSAGLANAVERDYDNHELGGKKLIVLRIRSSKDIALKVRF